MQLLETDDGDDRGYAVLGVSGVVALAATTAHAARELLLACLYRAVGTFTIRRLTGSHQWAMDAALGAGLTLEPDAPVFTRGLRGVPPTYLPSAPYL
jgi:hypothetical protein